MKMSGKSTLGSPHPSAAIMTTKAKWAALEWVVMLNHCHVLIELFEGVALGKIVLSWKNSSAQFINEHKGRTGVRRSREGYSSARQVLGVMKDHQRYGFKLIPFLFSIF
jgi:REP element-mobilizing transposase RayT